MSEERGAFLSFLMVCGLLMSLTASLFITIWFLQSNSPRRSKADKEIEPA